MSKQEFKQKYFTNNFYWINFNNYQTLQAIGVEFGCLNPVGTTSIIQWHDDFYNLGFRTVGNKPTKFHKECFLLAGKKATSFDNMLNDYKQIRKS